MKVTVEPFKAEHVAELTVQDAQRADWAGVSREGLASFEQTDAWTTRVDGKVILVGGLIEVWAGRAILWSYVAADAGKYMARITRGVLRFMEASGHRRIEMYVDANFAAGVRWAQLLGFHREAPKMAGFFPDGRDAILFARVR